MQKIISVFLVCLLILPMASGCANKNKADERSADERQAGERMTLTVNGIEYAFRWCPAGTFMMGSPASEPYRVAAERQYEVTLSRGFWMLETEVTQQMWASVMGDNLSFFYNRDPKHPVACVSWDECREYIKKLNDLKVAPAGFTFSLPTEAQWEYACRAGTTTAFHVGDRLTEQQANVGRNIGQTSEVGKYPANDWGLYDMHGNVKEWCADWYGDYPHGAVTDPVGYVGYFSCGLWSRRVIRGGCWIYEADQGRSAYRSYDFPSARYKEYGLRLALVSQR